MKLEIITCEGCKARYVEKTVCEEKFQHSSNEFCCLDCGCMCGEEFEDGAPVFPEAHPLFLKLLGQLQSKPELH